MNQGRSQANPGDSLLDFYTAEFYNEIGAYLDANEEESLSGAGPIFVSNVGGRRHIVSLKNRQSLSTIQGYLVGGSAPSVSNGTEIIDAYAWEAYRILGGVFVLNAGTCTVTVNINGTPVSWLNALSVTTTALVTKIPLPIPNLTHAVPVAGVVNIVITSASGASGLAFSLNTPF